MDSLMVDSLWAAIEKLQCTQINDVVLFITILSIWLCLCWLSFSKQDKK